MTSTNIEWADRVWNPIRGCALVSQGCKNCYAMKFAARFSGPGQPYEGLTESIGGKSRWTGQVKLIPSKLEDPLRWRKPSRVFVNSMSDLFHTDVPDDFIGQVFSIMAEAQKHTFQVLTKRADRMAQWFGSWAASDASDFAETVGSPWPLRNVWLGVSCEDQDAVDERVPLLLETPAHVRFVSAEPLIDELDLEMVKCPLHVPSDDGACWLCGSTPGNTDATRSDGYFNCLKEGIGWVIVGCESGKRDQCRPMDEGWVRSLRLQCRRNGVPFFYKQGRDEAGRVVSLPMIDGRSWGEYPGDKGVC